jgi:Protein of unknown function (DUF1800)
MILGQPAAFIPERAWEPFRPTERDRWDVKKVAHLHRRAAFGASRTELMRDLKEGPDAAVDRLLDPGEETAELREVISGLRTGILNSADKNERLPAYWLHRMLFHPDQLREKMTLFWHSHFATSNEKVSSEMLMLEQNELLRKHALGEFSSLLESILADPAMLIWLDGANSPRQKPNENLAREYLELFTLGVGNYTEKDIRQAARALTGWVHDAKTSGASGFQFDPAKFDDGPKTFLRSTGPWKSADIVRLTLAQPACARLLCRKLYRQFIHDDGEPAPGLIEPLAHELRSRDYSIRHVVGMILRSRCFYADCNRRQRIASPVELCVGLLRALDLPRADIRLLALAEACRAQGQELFHPPNVAGWAGGKRWITSTNWIERTNWLSDVIWGNSETDLPPFNPEAWAERNEIAPHKAVPALIDLLLQGDLSKEASELASGVASRGDPDGLRQAIQILVHCPEYQLV